MSRVGLTCSLVKGDRRQRDKGIAAFVEVQRAGKAGGGCAAGKSRAHDFTLAEHIHKEFGNLAGGAAHGRIAGAHDPDPVEQSHAAVHLEAEVGDILSGRCLEPFDAGTLDVVGQLQRGLACQSAAMRLR